jgi:hypothetical protein
VDFLIAGQQLCLSLRVGHTRFLRGIMLGSKESASLYCQVEAALEKLQTAKALVDSVQTLDALETLELQRLLASAISNLRALSEGTKITE